MKKLIMLTLAAVMLFASLGASQIKAHQKLVVENIGTFGAPRSPDAKVIVAAYEVSDFSEKNSLRTTPHVVHLAIKGEGSSLVFLNPSIGGVIKISAACSVKAGVSVMYIRVTKMGVVETYCYAGGTSIAKVKNSDVPGMGQFLLDRADRRAN